MHLCTLNIVRLSVVCVVFVLVDLGIFVGINCIILGQRDGRSSLRLLCAYGAASTCRDDLCFSYGALVSEKKYYGTSSFGHLSDLPASAS